VTLAIASLGCSGPNAQVARCQSEKQELLAVIEQEKVRTKAVEERAMALESRLDQSEKQLAQLVRPGARFGDDGPRTASSKGARPLDSAPPLPAAPVREPKPGATPGPAASSGAAVREMKLSAPAVGPAGEESGLASLAERDPRIEYDPSSGTARLKIDIPFDADGAGLTGEGRKRLDEVAAWLKAPQTSHLRILVAGHSSGMKKPPAGAEVPRYDNDRQLGAARAMAVADYLDRRGIKEDRLAVIGSGAKSPAGARSTPGTIEILLSEPDTPIAGLRPVGPVRR
jgi:outer membrane protein OmpA-like peptidoglycan-associated protein